MKVALGEEKIEKRKEKDRKVIHSWHAMKLVSFVCHKNDDICTLHKTYACSLYSTQ